MARAKTVSQADFSDWFDWRQRIPQDSVWRRIDTWCSQHVDDEQFAHLDATVGRPAERPSRVIRAILVQLHTGMSDRELEKASLSTTM